MKQKTILEAWKEACETPVPVNVDLTQPTDSRDIQWDLCTKWSDENQQKLRTKDEQIKDLQESLKHMFRSDGHLWHCSLSTNVCEDRINGDFCSCQDDRNRVLFLINEKLAC